MSTAMNKNASADATPDQMLTLLELQLAAQRQKRNARSQSRPLLVAGSLLLILGGAVAAFVVLHGMLVNLAGNQAPAPITPAAEIATP